MQGLNPTIVLFLTCLAAHSVTGFVLRPTSRTAPTSSALNLFEKLFQQAFENDPNLSNDKRTGSIDETGTDNIQPVVTRTATQEKWWQSQQKDKTEKASRAVAYTMDLYLTGVPSRDPSNDLFGARTTISSRDEQTGLLSVPDKPTCSSVVVTLLNETSCVVSTADEFNFCIEDGAGDVVRQGNNIRFRIPVSGYTRTVQTKGTIQNVFWSDEPSKTTATATTYSIPEGWLYFEGDTTVNTGVLKVEQTMGLLGAGSKMTACGKYVVQGTNAVDDA